MKQKDSQEFSIENSYLSAFESWMPKKSVAVYKINGTNLFHVSQQDHQELAVCMLCIKPQQRVLAKKVLPEIKKKLKPDGKLHVLIEASKPKRWDCTTVLSYFLLDRYLMRHNWSKIEAYGIEFDTWAPFLIIPFKKNIFRYVMTSFYRHTDSPLRHFIKKLIICVLGFWVWRGPIVLICTQ